MTFLDRRRLLVEGHAVALATWGFIWLLTRLYDHQPLPGIQCGTTGCRNGSWFDIALLISVAHFLYVKSWLMWRRTRKTTILGITLVWANVAFAIAYQAALVLILFPKLREETWISNALRIEILIPVFLGSVMLTLTKDPDPEAPTVWSDNRLLLAKVDELHRQIVLLQDQLERQEDEQRHRHRTGDSGIGRTTTLGDG